MLPLIDYEIWLAADKYDINKLNFFMATKNAVLCGRALLIISYLVFLCIEFICVALVACW